MESWSFPVYAVAVVGLAALMIAVSRLLGERHQGPAKDDPYESGMVPTGKAAVPYPARFYLVAVFFVIFDLEAVFLFAWAVSARTAGIPGYIEAMIFAAVLTVALGYLWRVGALDWGPVSNRRTGDTVVAPNRGPSP